MKRKLLIFAVALLCIVAALSFTVFAEEDGAPALKIEGANLSFEDSVYTVYAVSHPEIDKSDIRLLVWTAAKENPDAYLVGTENYVLSAMGAEARVNDTDCTVFINDKIYAKNMADDYYVRAYAEVDGTVYYSDIVKYSVLQYAYNKLGITGTATESETLKNMLTRMLSYGAAAQLHFEHNVDRLADSAFYQIKVEGGTLADGFTKGLYLEGDTVTLTAPATDTKGNAFRHWVNSNGEVVSTENPASLSVGTSAETYTAAYAPAIQYSEGLAYTLSSDGTYYIVRGIGTCTDTDLMIPPTHEGLPIKEIGNRAFSRRTSLTSITIPEGVTSIGNYAFWECSSLTSVSLPEGVTSIGNYAFRECSSLTSITIPEGVTSIENSAFFYCTSLTSITLPESLTSIGVDAFYRCSSLKSIYYGGTAEEWGVLSADSYLLYYYSEGEPIEEGKFWHYGEDGEIVVWPAYVGLTYTISDDGTYYIVSGIGTSTDTEIVILPTHGGLPVKEIADRAFYDCDSLTSITIPEGVTSIGERAFRNCSFLTSITISEGVTSIGDEAFYRCSSLTSITISEGVTSIGDSAFEYCSSLTNITLPESVTSIGNYAFYDCSSLTSITIPKGVTSIGERAFYDCDSLTSIAVAETSEVYQSIDGNLYTKDGTTLLQYAIGKKDTTFIIPEGVTSIGNYAFWGCSSLTSITLPESVTSIGNYAFSYCSSLTSITLPEGVTSIGERAFYDCDSLTSISVAETNEVYQSIDGNIYSKDEKVLILYAPGKQDTSFTIPEGVTSIGDRAFYYCRSLTSISLPKGVTSIGDWAFFGCDSLTSITLPESLTSIGEYAFSWCSALTSITLPEGVTSIGDYAFRGCDSLTSIILPEGLTSIGNYAFSDCSSLTSIILPEGVTSIENWAFEGCSSLTSVYYGGTAEEWDVLSANIGFDNDDLLGATRYYYSETEPTEEGNFWHYDENGEIAVW